MYLSEYFSSKVEFKVELEELNMSFQFQLESCFWVKSVVKTQVIV